MFPLTISVVLADHVRAQRDNPDGPNNANTICSSQAISGKFIWGVEHVGVDSYHMIFDRGEPFKGYLDDRLASKKARRRFPELEKVKLVTEGNSGEIIGLQVADLFAWCVSQKNQRDFAWQRRLLNLDRHDQWLDYAELMKPIPEAMALTKHWKLPTRRATK